MQDEQQPSQEPSEPREESQPQGLFSEPVSSMESEPEHGRDEEGIGLGRIVRLLVLLGVLAAVIVAAISMTGGRPPEEDAAPNVPTTDEEPAGGGLSEQYKAQMRAALEKGDLGDADETAALLVNMVPDDEEVGHLLVALGMARFIQTNDSNVLVRVAQTFNAILTNADGEIIQEQWDAIAPADSIARLLDALEDYPPFHEAARTRLLNESDAEFVASRMPLWVATRNLVRGEEEQAAAALRICNWMALHILPADPLAASSVPASTLGRGTATPEQAAWLYAELCRQAWIGAHVFRAGERCMVQVYPAGANPFVVDPWLGVPLLDPADGRRLSLADFQGSTDLWRRVMRAAGVAEPGDAEDVELYVAAHPRAFYDRIQAFAGLIDLLPMVPATAVNVDLWPAGSEFRLWPGVMEQVTPENRQLDAWRKERERPVVALVEPGRMQQSTGNLAGAARFCDSQRQFLESALREADIPEAIEASTQALEALAWLRASCLFDMGRFDEAQAAAEAYMAAHPDGAWSLGARLLLAEVHAQAGRADAAKAIWQDLPEARRLYGAYRAGGLLEAVLPPKATPRAE